MLTNPKCLQVKSIFQGLVLYFSLKCSSWSVMWFEHGKTDCKKICRRCLIITAQWTGLNDRVQMETCKPALIKPHCEETIPALLLEKSWQVLRPNSEHMPLVRETQPPGLERCPMLEQKIIWDLWSWARGLLLLLLCVFHWAQLPLMCCQKFGGRMPAVPHSQF